MPTQSSLAAILEEHTLGALVSTPEPIGGGDSTPAYRLQTTRGLFFAKRVSVEARTQLHSEATSLAALADIGVVRVPTVIACDSLQGDAWLVLEWLDIRPLGGQEFETLGRQLSNVHRLSAEQFGWSEDNWIGNSPQINTPTADWLAFYRDCRLQPQIEWARGRGVPASFNRLTDRLLERLPDCLDQHVPAISLTHGDLWGGNVGMADRPVIYDPACFFGDREMDLAMARLFGGFGESFYAAYNEAWPLPPGSLQRVGLYQIYHQLNHLNLFGGAYLGACERTIRQILATL
ncbi:MAG: fructosamine kinase family protein [Pseudomonadota bacterium]